MHLSLHKPCIYFKAIATIGTNEPTTFVGTALKSAKGLTEAQVNKVQQLVEWHARGSDIPAAAQHTTLTSLAKAASKTAAKPIGRASTAATKSAQPVVVPQVSCKSYSGIAAVMDDKGNLLVEDGSPVYREFEVVRPADARQPVVHVSSSNQPQTAPTAATKPWWSSECTQMEDQGDPPGECNSLASHM